MVIELSAELQEVIETDVATGAYSSVDDFIIRAVMELHERERWLAEHRDQIHRMIDEGWKSAERGELIDENQARREMQERKARSRAQPIAS